MKLTNEFDSVRTWANDKGILAKGDPKTQFIKLLEEVGELSRSILKSNDTEFVDAIGDCVIVLTNLSAIKGYTIEECINSAYEVIKSRTGKMENGTFVKNEI
jgi:NTP pyrophosphatase (non-canonical NTP hydrolase)